MLQMMREEFSLVPHKTLMIGDRLDTDIAFGFAAGTQHSLLFPPLSLSFSLARARAQSGSYSLCVNGTMLRAGMRTALPLTGVTTTKMLAELPAGAVRPDFVLPSIASITLQQ